MDEFALIAEYLAPLAALRPGAFGLADDAALVPAPPGRDLVASADALVAGVHFRERDPPDTVAARALRCSLSDLAAMGAEPYGYLLTLALPHGVDAEWMAAFASRLARDQAEFSIALLGGDTVATPGPLTVSLTVLGFAEPERLLRRSGARAGDAVCVSGVIGDAALALAIPDAAEALRARYRAPEPRLALGRALAGNASAAIDVSDGLVADLGHVCVASGVGARLDAALGSAVVGGARMRPTFAGADRNSAVRRRRLRIAVRPAAGAPRSSLCPADAGPPHRRLHRRGGG